MSIDLTLCSVSSVMMKPRVHLDWKHCLHGGHGHAWVGGRCVRIARGLASISALCNELVCLAAQGKVNVCGRVIVIYACAAVEIAIEIYYFPVCGQRCEHCGSVCCSNRCAYLTMLIVNDDFCCRHCHFARAFSGSACLYTRIVSVWRTYGLNIACALRLGGGVSCDTRSILHICHSRTSNDPYCSCDSRICTSLSDVSLSRRSSGLLSALASFWLAYALVIDHLFLIEP